MDRVSILFLCTGNSARSIMAEAIANDRFSSALVASSAGSHPRAEVHPLALETLRHDGLSTDDLRPKNWDELKDRSFDVVVTLCNEAAAESCPHLGGAPVAAHWSLPDPPLAGDAPAMFKAVCDVLREAIGLIAQDPDRPLADRCAEATRVIRDRGL